MIEKSLFRAIYEVMR